MQEVAVNGEELIFHPSGVVYWREQKALLIADVHLGKISHFRKFGSAVPEKAILKNFEQLKAVVHEFHPETIYFLGDLFHSSFNQEFQYFKEWVEKQSATIVLIIGNHDIISPIHFEKLGIKIKEEVFLKKFVLTHHPEEREGFFNICGHIHPGFRLRGIGKQHEKLRCFYKTEKRLILPAFGTFTGNYMIQPKTEDEVYVCTASEVIAIP